MILNKSDENSVELCAEALKNGKIIIIPTDTVYGFSGIVMPSSPLEMIVYLLRKANIIA